MDTEISTETAEKISQLAKSLKDLHLAASAEEAFERAKEIILGTPAQGHEKSAQELMGEVTLKDLQKAKELLEQEEKTLKSLKKELDELKEKQQSETQHHDEHKQETEDIDNSLTEDEYDVGVVEENVEVSDEVQDSQE